MGRGLANNLTESYSWLQVLLDELRLILFSIWQYKLGPGLRRRVSFIEIIFAFLTVVSYCI